MSYENFDRRYSLIIGSISRTIKSTIPAPIAADNIVTDVPRYLSPTRVIRNTIGVSEGAVGIDYRTIPDRFIEVRDLSMRAKIIYKKSGSKGGTQSSVIELDNLSEDTLGKIKENDLIFLKAGYRLDLNTEVSYEDLPLILSSTISDISTDRKRDGTITTTLTCSDNILPKKNLKISKSWPPNTSKRTVLNDLIRIAQTNFVPLGRVIEIENFISPLEETYPFGYSVAGNLFDELSKLAESIDYRFYVSLSKIYFEPKSFQRVYEIVDIFPENLKQPITSQSDSSTKKSGSKVKKNGVRVQLFLNGRISSSMHIQVLNYLPEYNGTYNIEAIEHKLDFEGNDWDTLIKANRVG